MRNRKLSKLVGVAGGVVLAFLFLFSQSALAGQNQTAKEKADSAQKASVQQPQEKQTPTAPARTQSGEARSTGETRDPKEETTVAAEKPPADGSHEGIKVHGHWTIEVRNLDGTLVTHREFDNSLVSAGALVLTKCLAKACIINQWQIALDGAGQTGACIPTCFINVSPTIPNNGPNAGQFVLSGNQTVSSAGALQQVSTVLLGQLDSVAATSFEFTSRSLTSPIPVVATQIVQVMVVISFS